MSLYRVLLAPVAVALVAAGPGRPDRRFDAESVEFFEKQVRPLLVNNCNNCHSASTNAKGGLRVDDRNGLLQGGNRGPAVVPGDPANSLLIEAVVHTDPDLKMPPKKHLSADEIAILTKLMGLDHERLTFRYAGRDFRLTDVAGNVVREIMA